MRLAPAFSTRLPSMLPVAPGPASKMASVRVAFVVTESEPSSVRRTTPELLPRVRLLTWYGRSAALMTTVYVPDAMIATSLPLAGTPLLQFARLSQKFAVPRRGPIQLLLFGNVLQTLRDAAAVSHAGPAATDRIDVDVTEPILNGR